MTYAIRSVFIALIFLVSAQSYAQSQGQNETEIFLEDPAKEAHARAIMKQIRCLQCQNQSIEDSNADLAKDLRKLVRLKVSEGMSEAEIKDYLVARYSDWILLKPPVKSSTYLLWGSPILLLIGVSVAIINQRRKALSPEGNQPADRPGLTPEEEAVLARILTETEDKLQAEEKDQ